MVVLLVFLEVAVQFVDAGGQQCNLDFRRTGVFVATCVVRDDRGLVDVFYGHDITFHMRCKSRNPAHRELLKNLATRPRP